MLSSDDPSLSRHGGDRVRTETNLGRCRGDSIGIYGRRENRV